MPLKECVHLLFPKWGADATATSRFNDPASLTCRHSAAVQLAGPARPEIRGRPYPVDGLIIVQRNESAKFDGYRKAGPPRDSLIFL